MPRIQIPSFSGRSLQLSPVVAEDDELIAAIDSEAIRHDDTWQLEATADAENLQQFWASVDSSEE